MRGRRKQHLLPSALSYVAHNYFISTGASRVSILGYRAVCKVCQDVMREEQAEKFLSQLEDLLGPRIYRVLALTLEDDFFGNEKDLKRILQERPELFERAFRGVLGELAGTAVLRVVDQKLEG